MGSGTDVSGIGRPSEPVRDLVRSVVAGLAPEELPLVDGLRRFDDATVVRRLNGRGGHREPLSFGAHEIVLLVTPVVWLVLDAVAQRMAAATADRVAQGATGTLRRIFRRPAAPVEVPPLTREQLTEVRALVLATAEQRGLSPRRAAEIADALVARLALSGGEDSSAEDSPAGPDDGTAPDAGTGRD
ncbi:hypothetical protein ACIRD2_12840 [Streptomyces sp. NPDC093595]|uniref:hypothetical protein n=1 Tax=Streptomyces sp. NPDC093595 TaxID=3366045 RepID=UPI0037FA3DBD